MDDLLSLVHSLDFDFDGIRQPFDNQEAVLSVYVIAEGW